MRYLSQTGRVCLQAPVATPGHCLCTSRGFISVHRLIHQAVRYPGSSVAGMGPTSASSAARRSRSCGLAPGLQRAYSREKGLTVCCRARGGGDLKASTATQCGRFCNGTTYKQSRARVGLSMLMYTRVSLAFTLRHHVTNTAKCLVWCKALSCTALTQFVWHGLDSSPSAKGWLAL